MGETDSRISHTIRSVLEAVAQIDSSLCVNIRPLLDGLASMMDSIRKKDKEKMVSSLSSIVKFVNDDTHKCETIDRCLDVYRMMSGDGMHGADDVVRICTAIDGVFGVESTSLERIIRSMYEIRDRMVRERPGVQAMIVDVGGRLFDIQLDENGQVASVVPRET